MLLDRSQTCLLFYIKILCYLQKGIFLFSVRWSSTTMWFYGLFLWWKHIWNLFHRTKVDATSLMVNCVSSGKVMDKFHTNLYTLCSFIFSNFTYCDDGSLKIHCSNWIHIMSSLKPNEFGWLFTKKAVVTELEL